MPVDIEFDSGHDKNPVPIDTSTDHYANKLAKGLYGTLQNANQKFPPKTLFVCF